MRCKPLLLKNLLQHYFHDFEYFSSIEMGSASHYGLTQILLMPHGRTIIVYDIYFNLLIRILIKHF